MHIELTKYVPIIDFLAEVLGKQTEIVLQEIRQEETGYVSSIVYIKNNISGRQIGAPGTDFVSKIIKSKAFKEEDFMVNYTGKSAQGNLLKSSSMFIKDKENNLIGMLCINIDNSKLDKVVSLFDMGLQTLQGYLQDNQEHLQTNLSQTVQENMYLTHETSIEEAIYEFTGTKNITLTYLSKKKKKEIVSHLFDKGFFEIKDSVAKTANIFSMSEVSIYKYLQEIKEQK